MGEIAAKTDVEKDIGQIIEKLGIDPGSLGGTIWVHNFDEAGAAAVRMQDGKLTSVARIVKNHEKI